MEESTRLFLSIRLLIIFSIAIHLGECKNDNKDDIVSKNNVL